MSDETSLEIARLGNEVGGIASSPNTKTVFVRGALPGDTVRCRIKKEKKKWLEAELLEVLVESQDRREPFCEYFGECGGCSLQHLDYPKQLFWKRKWIERALSRTGVKYADGIMNDVIPSPLTSGYRNRVSFDIAGGKPGLHRYRGDIMPVETCPLLNRKGQATFKKLLSENMNGYRRVSVRASDRTDEAMVEFSGLPDTGLTGTIDADIIAWKERDGWKSIPDGATLHESLGELTFSYKPGSFFQVNTGSAETIISIVNGLCDKDGKVLDLYGGCGTFALPLAFAGREVTSVELNPDSSSSGRDSAARLGIEGVTFLSGRTRHYLLETVNSEQPWNTVIVDPPRGGLGIRVSRLLRRVNSKRILYVSCNPFSLARDLGIICDGGWAIARLQPVDMFPQTDHVETIAELKRKDIQ